MKKLLLSFAHPDDESFSSGLTIAKYAKNGWDINLIVATNGEAGQSGPYDLKGSALGSLRRAELEDAAKILGISAISFLGFGDGRLKEIPAGELEEKIYIKMLEYAPDIVITYDTTGVSNHPDHKKICYSTTYAFQKYAEELDITRNFLDSVNNNNIKPKTRNFLMRHKKELKHKFFTDALDKDDMPKLYYACIPKSEVRFMQKIEVMREEAFGEPIKGVDDDKITTVINGKDYKIRKLKALAAHKTQTEDVDRFYSNDANPCTQKEFFILRYHGPYEIFMGKNDSISDRL